MSTGARVIPTQALFEERIASLEGAEAGLAVASGMAAISSTLWTSAAGRRPRGDRPHALRQQLRPVHARPDAFRREGDGGGLHRPRHCRPHWHGQSAPKLVFFESPANPNLRIIDIAAVAGWRIRPGPC